MFLQDLERACEREAKFADSGVSRQLIPILGFTTDDRAVGTVPYLALSFEERSDRSGLMVHFQNGPARFSSLSPYLASGKLTPTGPSPVIGPLSGWTVLVAGTLASTLGLGSMRGTV